MLGEILFAIQNENLAHHWRDQKDKVVKVEMGGSQHAQDGHQADLLFAQRSDPGPIHAKSGNGSKIDAPAHSVYISQRQIWERVQ